MKSISLTLNGRQITSTCEVHETLRTFLRSQGMFSVHYGSDSGETGAGAVLLDGELVSSDVVLAVQADGHSITTVEAPCSTPHHPRPPTPSHGLPYSS